MSLRFWLATSIVVALAQPAYAGDSDCSYIEIAATKSDKAAMDPELKPLEKKLRKAPFSAWNTFKKLSAGTVALTKNKQESIRLRQGSASLMLRDRSEKRVELTITKDDAKGKRVLEAKPALKVADYLIVGGPGDSDDAGHMLALTCK